MAKMEKAKIESIPVLENNIPNSSGEVLNIRKLGDLELRKCAEPIKVIDGEIKKLAQQMLNTMYEGGGCGLAATQVGRPVRLIVLDIDKGPMILINPTVLKRSWRKIEAEEGCLSVPDITVAVKRAKKVEVEFFQIDNGKRAQIKAEDLLARVLLHEIEHLDGILIVDKLSFWRKWRLIKGRQNREIKKI
jgi:peptide deformylase